MLASAGFFEAMYSAIAEEEASTIHYNAARLAENMYGQMNSVYGIMENIVSDYTEVDMDATNIQEKLANPENLTLLKNVMTKLG
jgi:hypothetical protein